MAIQDSINSAISTVAYASAAHGVLTNQQAQMKATDSLKDELASIRNYQEKMKNKFGIDLTDRQAKMFKDSDIKPKTVAALATTEVNMSGEGKIEDLVGGKK